MHMRAMKFFFFFPLCAICILSCTSVEKKDMQEDILFVYLTDSSKFVLLPTEGIEKSMDMVQSVSAVFRGKDEFFNVLVMADKNAIEMIFLNELGASVGELSYRDGAVHFSSTVIPNVVIKSFRMEYVIADYQLCFYNPFLLGQSLKDCGLVLETIDGSRRILSGNEVIIEINKTDSAVELVNHQWGYNYILEGDFNNVLGTW